MISRTRGYLPHLEISEGTYFLTFRLADSIPAALLVNLKAERFLKKSARMPADLVLAKDEYDRKIEALLDTGAGECWLSDQRSKHCKYSC